MSAEIPFVRRGGSVWLVRAVVAVVFVTASLANTLHMVRFGMRALDIATMHLINLALFVVVMGVTRECPPRRAFVLGLFGAPLALVLANWVSCALLWRTATDLHPVWNEILFAIVPGCALHGWLVGRAMQALNEVRLTPTHDALDRSLRGLAPLLSLALLDACGLMLHRPFSDEMGTPAASLGEFFSPVFGPFVLASMLLTVAIPFAMVVRDVRRVRFLAALRSESAWRVEPATKDEGALLPWVTGFDDATLVRVEASSGEAFRASSPRSRVARVSADLDGMTRALKRRVGWSAFVGVAALLVAAVASTLRW